MRPNWIATFLAVCLLLACPANAQMQERVVQPVPGLELPGPFGFDNHHWQDSTGKVRTLDDLEDILSKHAQWLYSKGSAGQPADLHDAKLYGIDLSGVNLERASLSHANLVAVNLRGALLQDADLRRLFTSGIGWRGPAAVRQFAIKLAEQDQSFYTDLSAARLSRANLTGASLAGAELRDAELDGAKLEHVVFEPRSLPKIPQLAAAENLESTTYLVSPVPLVQLRKAFKESGFEDQERSITYALKRRENGLRWRGCFPWAKEEFVGQKPEAWRLWETRSFFALSFNCTAYVFDRGFFDLTCQYGRSPGRSLRLLAGLWLSCAFIYYLLILHSKRAAFYVVPNGKPSDRPGDQGGQTTGKTRVRRLQRIGLTRIRPPQLSLVFRLHRESLAMLRRWLKLKWRLLRAAMFFSLVSAFNIGYRELNLGQWLRMLTKREYEIKAVGWARAVAGWQSLTSVYLIALWLLTYFGQPFE